MVMLLLLQAGGGVTERHLVAVENLAAGRTLGGERGVMASPGFDLDVCKNCIHHCSR